MYKVYGFKEEDIKDLAIFIKNNRFSALTKLFSAYAEHSGKATGSVRNLYYALAKTAKNDEEFCREYLGGKPITVGKTRKFDKTEEAELLRTVFLGIKNGDSVRKTINAIAGDNGKTALRFQNKYRSLLKNRRELVKEVSEKVGIDIPRAATGYPERFSSDAENRVRREIDGLINRISAKIKAENCRLKERIVRLERENRELRLKTLNPHGKKIVKYFDNGGISLSPDGYGLN